MQPHDPFDLVGNDEQKAKREKAQRLDAYLSDEDMKWFMGAKRGRRIAYRILDRSGVFRSSFTGNSETFFREGMRNVGLILLNQIHEVVPESYVLMMKERNDRSSSSDSTGTN